MREAGARYAFGLNLCRHRGRGGLRAVADAGKQFLTLITDCDINITIRDKTMKLSEKVRYLREVEGSLRGLGRAMTQQELVRAMEEGEAGGAKAARKPRAKAAGAAMRRGTISQSYLSQIESGARPHLTNTTRLLLAKFFQVHPGYLVDDPEGYHAELMSEVRAHEDKLDLWLISGAERFRRDPELGQALLTLAHHADSRRCLLLLESVLETPALVERLLQVLRPEASTADKREQQAKDTEQAKERGL